MIKKKISVDNIATRIQYSKNLKMSSNNITTDSFGNITKNLIFFGPEKNCNIKSFIQ